MYTRARRKKIEEKKNRNALNIGLVGDELFASLICLNP
jgi:hypothetical protein